MFRTQNSSNLRTGSDQHVEYIFSNYINFRLHHGLHMLVSGDTYLSTSCRDGSEGVTYSLDREDVGGYSGWGCPIKGWTEWGWPGVAWAKLLGWDSNPGGSFFQF